MHTGGMMNAGQAPYQKAANDECRICGGKRKSDSLVLLFLLSRMDRKFIDFQRYSSYSYYYAHITGIGHW